jgi:choline dehydrogenase-like flavoprotein
MIDDLTAIENGRTLEVDVCIVGAGAAGIAVAREFANDGFRRVLVLESGGKEVDGETEVLNSGEVAGAPFNGLTDGRRRGFGGTTSAWGGQCRMLDKIDFEERPWVPNSGWPFGPELLDPYYRRAEEFFAVSGERYDDSVWRRFRIAPIQYDRNQLKSVSTVICPKPAAIAQRYRRLLETSNAVRVLLRATVTSLCLNDAGTRVEGLTVRGPGDRTVTIRARNVVLCMGGIETPRLLLASRTVERDGVANRYGNVGRYFHDHASSLTAVIRSRTPSRIQELYSLLYGRSKRYWPKIALAEHIQRKRGVLNAVAVPYFEFDRESAIAVLKQWVRAKRSGEAALRWREDLAAVLRGSGEVVQTISRRYLLGRSPLGSPTRMLLHCQLEQVPERESRVTLSDRCDRFGVPLPRVEWKRSLLERDTLRVLTETVGNEWKRLGIAELEPMPWLYEDGAAWIEGTHDAFHHFGATRMSQSARGGVVDADCRVHGVDGLFIVSSSVFPASGVANPTLTIVALGLRVADRVRSLSSTN